MAGNVLASLLLGIATKADTSGLNKVDSGLKKLGNTSRKVSAQAGMLGKITSGLFGGFSIGAIKGAFDSYLQFEKDLGAMKSRFYAITKDEAKATEEFEYIRKLATDTANDIKSTADSYSIFYSSAQRSLGKEGARGVFEAWTKVGRVLHLNEQQFERVTYALREMSSKGTLYSQDLKMQLGTHVPDAVNLATEAIKKLGIENVDTIEKFQKYTKSKQDPKIMGRFLIAFSQEAQRRFGSEEAVKKALEQPDALVQNIRNIGQNFAIEFSKRGGGYMIVKILQGISDVLLKVNYEKLASVLGSIAKGFGLIFSFLAKNIAIIINLLRTIIALKTFNKIRDVFMGTQLGQSLKLFGVADTGVLAKLGMFGWLGKIISKVLGNFGIKAVGTGILKLLGPLGMAMSLIITFLPEIFKLISWISKKLNKTDTLQNWLQSSGASGEQVLTALDYLDKHKDKIHNIAEAQEIAERMIGSKEVAKNISYNDNGRFTINFNGNFLTEEDIKNQINLAIDTRNGKGGVIDIKSKYNNVPSIEELLKGR